MTRAQLQKQYGIAYKKFCCPICNYPIRPNALKFSFLAQQNLKNVSPLDISYINSFEAYFCPSCGTQLFEKCDSCEHTRHSLLLFCEYCGEKKIA